MGALMLFSSFVLTVRYQLWVTFNLPLELDENMSFLLHCTFIEVVNTCQIRWHIIVNWCCCITWAVQFRKLNIISISVLWWHYNSLLRFPCLCVSGKGWLSGHITATPHSDPGECPALSVSDPRRRQLPHMCVSRQADKRSWNCLVMIIPSKTKVDLKVTFDWLFCKELALGLSSNVSDKVQKCDEWLMWVLLWPNYEIGILKVQQITNKEIPEIPLLLLLNCSWSKLYKPFCLLRIFSAFLWRKIP